MAIPHPLQGAFDRVDRAERHLADFRIIESDFGQANHDAITIEYNSDPPHHAKPRLNIVAPPTEAAILLGEILYNLRAALDYLIFELALKDSGKLQSGTQFPICDRKSSFDGVAPKHLVGLNASHWAAIERLQPYNGCVWTERLRDISNPDKHRRLTAQKPSFFVRLSSLPEPLLESKMAPLFRSVRPTKRPSGEELDMHLVSEFPIMIFVKVAPGATGLRPVVEVIDQITAGVRETLDAFKPEFFR